MQPVYTVEKSGFKLLVSKQNPQYNLPPRNHFTEVETPKLYVEVRDSREAKVCWSGIPFCHNWPVDKPSQADHSENIAEDIVDVLGIRVSKLVATTDMG